MNKEMIIDGANILKEKINMCFILLLNKLETTETIERTIYEHIDAFVEEWNDLFQRKGQECEKYEKALDEIMKFTNISTCNICKGEDTQACSECNVNTIKDIINKAKGEENAI